MITTNRNFDAWREDLRRQYNKAHDAMLERRGCVFTTTTVVRGWCWGIADDPLCEEAVKRAEASVAPCIIWLPVTSEVHACLNHAYGLADFLQEVVWELEEELEAEVA